MKLGIRSVFVNGPIFLALASGLATLSYAIVNFDNHPNWALFIIVASLVVCILAFALFLVSYEKRKNAALVISSIYFALFAFNFVLETTGTRIRPVHILYEALDAAEKAGVAYDKRSMSEVVLDMREQGVMAYPNIGPRGPAMHPDVAQPVFPIAGIANVTTVLCNESGEYAIYQSDKFGFNNDNYVYEQKGPRVLLVGDSFTHGYCVSRDQNVAGGLSRHGHKVVNLGIVGSGPLSELATLREYGPYLKPQVTVWLWWHGNDLEELAHEIKHPVLQKYVADRKFTQNLRYRQKEIDTFHKHRMGEWKRVPHYYGKYLNNEITEKEFRDNLRAYLKGVFTLHKLRYLVSLSREQFVSDLTASEKELFHHLRAILQEAKWTAESWGGAILFRIHTVLRKNQRLS